MFATSPSGAPAGSRRFWITVICFALANTAAWGVFYGLAYLRRPPLLRIERFEPKEGSAIGVRPVFTWHFNLELAARGSDAPGFITPAVPGHWSQPEGRTLVFTPDADLPKATRFTLTLPAQRLRSRNGYALEKTFTCNLHTAELQWLDLRQAGIEPGGQMILELEFSDRVLSADVAKRLTLIQHVGSEQPHPIHFQVLGKASGNIVRLRTEAVWPILQGNPTTCGLKVQLDAGLCGASGPLAMSQGEQRELGISSTLVATHAYGESKSNENSEICLQFNGPIEGDILRQVLSIEPAVAYHLHSSYGSGSCTYWYLSGAFTPNTRYAVKLSTVPAALKDEHYPLPDTLSVLMPEVSPRVWFEQTEGYLGSGGNRLLLAHAVNVGDLKVCVTRVYDNNLVTWRNASGRYWRDADPERYSHPLAERPIHLTQTRNKTQDIRIDLDELLPQGASRDGVYRVAICSPQDDADNSQDEFVDYDDASTVVTLSDLGLSVKRTRDALVGWVVSLSSGKPVAGARLRLYSTKNQPLGEAQSDADGLARINDVHARPGEEPAVVLADMGANGGGLTWLDLRSGHFNLDEADVSGRPYLRGGFEAFLYSDRGVYRPGEMVHLRAVVRGSDNAAPSPFPVRWLLRRPDGHPWKSEVVVLDADGAAALDLELPADLPTGRWSAELGLPGKGETIGEKYGDAIFQIEEFLPNRMKVALELAAGPQQPGTDNRLSISSGKLVADVQGDYLFGKPAAECSATLVATAEPAAFSSPRWAGWTFGDSAQSREALSGTHKIGGRLELPPATLDAQGKARWEIAADKLFDVKTGGVGPWRVLFCASVLETGGRAVSASQGVQIDTIPYYLGLQLDNATFSAHQSAAARIVLVAPSGSALRQHASLEVNLYRESWNNSLICERGRYHYQSTRRLESVQKPQIISLDGGSAKVPFVLPDDGAFVLSLRDTQTGDLVSRRVYASGWACNDNISREHPDALELVVVRGSGVNGSDIWKSIRHLDGSALWQLARSALVAPVAATGGGAGFKVGDEARVIVRSPFVGQLLLSVETDSVLSTQVIAMRGSQVMVPIRITDACRPGAYVTATVLRKIDPNAKWATHRAFGIARLNLDNSDQRLNVDLSAPTQLRPGQSLDVLVRLTDSAGHPAANAALTLAAVDEGICDLTHFATPDPLAYFTSPRALGVKWCDIYNQLMPEIARPDKQSAVGGDGGEEIDAGHMSPVSSRRVHSVSLISPVLHTDADGIAHAAFSLPEFTGQVRLMAVAYGGRKFGCQKGAVFVRSPLLVQSSWPRFAAPGDSFAVPLTLFNNSDSDASVQLSIQWLDDDPPLAFAPGAARTLELVPLKISAGRQAVASFNVVALQNIGVAHAVLRARMGSETFEEHVELPVRPASPRISVGAYATVSPQTALPINLPGDFVAGTFHLQIQAGQRPALELPRGLDYLDNYPYGCCEQITSGCFPLVYLSDIGKEIAPDVFTPQHVNLRVQAGILRLLSMQCEDGGIAMWPGEREAWPWGSVYAAHFLVQAKAAGFDVPRDFSDSLLAYVRRQIDRGNDTADDIETNCYGCYVLALAGKADQAVINRLAQVLEAPPLHAQASLSEDRPAARFHLAAAYFAAGRRDLAVHLIPHTLPQPRTQRQMENNIGSPVRDRAIWLDTLLSVAPDHPEIPGLAQQIADAGAHQRWLSTQDAAFAVMALGHYLRQAQSEAPYESVELLAGASQLARSTGATPLSWSATTRPSGALAVRITGSANARAHVSYLASGFPTRVPADADAGMQIRRRYLDAHGQTLGAIVHSGDLVQVELTLQSSTPLQHVVIDDLLPAGLEIENPRLETAADAKHVAKKPADNEPVFAVHACDMRDDRLILVGDLPQAGTVHYVYLARAVAPGTFVIPPVQAQCMYDIGTQSLSGSQKTLRVLGVEKSMLAHTGDDP